MLAINAKYAKTNAMNPTAKNTKIRHALEDLVERKPARRNDKVMDLLTANKKLIVRAIRKGHTIAVISKAISVPIRTLTRYMSDQNISARLLRTQYQRKKPNLAAKTQKMPTPVIVP